MICPPEKEVVLIQKATIYDLMRIKKSLVKLTRRKNWKSCLTPISPARSSNPNRGGEIRPGFLRSPLDKPIGG